MPTIRCVGVSRSLSTLLVILGSSFVCLTQASHLAPRSSPKASTDLICHTSDIAECYPKIFSPTKDFHIVHDDQSIPPGLHVRMNLETGVKEARLNVPEGDGDRAKITVIDNVPARHKEHEGLRGTHADDGAIMVQDQAILYNSFEKDGNVPPTGQRTATLIAEDDSPLGVAARLISNRPSVDPNQYLTDLDTLTDFAHDVEWGLALMQDRGFSKLLMRLVRPDHFYADIKIRSAGALLLGTALQNNHGALNELLSHPLEAEDMHPIAAVTSSLSHFADLPKPSSEDTLYAKRVVFLLSQLCQNDEQLQRFLEYNGLDLVTRLFNDQRLTKVKGGPILQAKIKNFADDHAEAFKTMHPYG